MNLLSKKWINPSKLKVEYLKDKMIVENTGEAHKFLVFPKLFKAGKEKAVSLNIQGNVIEGQGCSFKILNRHRTIMGTCGLNSYFQFTYNYLKYFIICAYVPGKSRIEITKAEYLPQCKLEVYMDEFQGDTLLLTPGYPSLENKYNCAFVHTRMKAYQEAGMNVDVLCVRDIHDTSLHEFEGVKVVTSDFFYLRTLLQKRQYKRVIVHFFNEKFANVFESVDMSNTRMYFYLHGAETLYRDWPKIVSPYFGPRADITDFLEKQFKVKDYYIEKYSQFENAKWVFVTPWTKQRCQELLNVDFKNSEVIPCLIDTELFSYEKKDPELRKKIFVLRKFDDIASYSLDTVVRVILALSHRDFFNDIEFNIYGDGSLHEKLLAPVRQFENVHIYKKFLSHDQIREAHRENGIALFPTRFDSQAVSSCEACSSGLAVISSENPGVQQFIPEDLGVLCPVEDPEAYADVIEKMYRDPDYFLEVARRESESVREKYNYQQSIQRDIDMFAEDEKDGDVDTLDFSNVSEKPVLSVVVPSYNVEKFLRGTVISMLEQRNAGKIEIIIVNDGSKDKTIDIAKELEARAANPVRNIVRIIDKENGGHGSTINAGLKMAEGKYFKVVDGDDTMDSEQFADLIDILEKEDCDVVLNNYVQDIAKDNESIPVPQYKELKTGVKYHFDDLCYPDYGFSTFGPIMSCSSYKTEKLREANVVLLEKMFYVDMLLNTYIAINFDTVIYYPLNIYRYMLGSATQSVSTESYKRRWKDHENVCIRMAELYTEKREGLSEIRRKFILDNLIVPMFIFQYNLAIEKMRSRKAFLSFDKRLKPYKEFYNEKQIVMTKLKFHRPTKGIFMFMQGIFEVLWKPFRKKKEEVK